MKRWTHFPIALALALPMAAQDAARDSTGLPGDHFNLEGALDLFKRNLDMEGFEKELNTDSNRVNNLDLDGNGEIDYVRVETQRDGNAAYVVLKVAVSATESQDVAVIAIEKTGEESAILQIIGDEALYGTNAIVEPYAEEQGMAPSKGPSALELRGFFVTVNCWYWEPIPWFFSARWYPYASPWYWGYYPPWWSPWRPYGWHTWYGWWGYHDHWYRPWNSCRVGAAQGLYMPRRAQSAIVRDRYRDAHDRYAKDPTRQKPRPGLTDGVRQERPAKDGVQQRPVSPDRPQPGREPAVRPSQPGKAPATRPGKQPGKQPTVTPGKQPRQPQVKPARKPGNHGTRPAPRPAPRPGRGGR